MPRVCFVLNVRPERLAEYRERHRAVRPEMRAALAAAGRRDYSLFLRDDGLLVGCPETEDSAAARAAMAATDVNARRQAEMAPYFETPAGVARNDAMVPLTEIFHLHRGDHRTTQPGE